MGKLLAGSFCSGKGDSTIRRQESGLASDIWTRRGDIELRSDDYSLTNEMMALFNAGWERMFNW